MDSYHKDNAITLLLAVLLVFFLFLSINGGEVEATPGQHPASNPFSNKWGDKKQLGIATLRETVRLLDSHAVPHFLAYGTLLGYARHRDFIPWDDDIDLIVLSEPSRVREVFRRGGRESSLTLHTHEKGFDKVFHPDASPVEGHPWKWPFVDLFYGERSDDHVLVYYRWRHSLASIYKADWVFPLIRGEFLNIEVSLPKGVHKVLKRDYDRGYNKWCVSGSFDHRGERREARTYVIPCKRLMDDPGSGDVPVFVINLDRRPDRRESVKRELAKLGMNRPIWVRAVDAEEPRIKRLHALLPPDRISRGEIACGFSHIKVWKRIVREAIPLAMIVEDDIVVPESINAADLQKRISDSRGGDVILLGYCGGKVPVVQRERRIETTFPGSAVCLHAYLVYRSGAKRLLKLAKGWDFSVPIDWITEKMCHDGLCFLSTHVSNPQSSHFGYGMIFQNKNLGTDIDNKKKFESYARNVPQYRNK